MTDDEYNYRISPTNLRAVQKCPKRSQEGRPRLWTLYTWADSEDEAERILFLLQNPRVEGSVRE